MGLSVKEPFYLLVLTMNSLLRMNPPSWLQKWTWGKARNKESFLGTFSVTTEETSYRFFSYYICYLVADLLFE